MSAQRQDDLTAQMNDVLKQAVDAGCYDAHEWIVRRWERRQDERRFKVYYGSDRSFFTDVVAADAADAAERRAQMIMPGGTSPGELLEVEGEWFELVRGGPEHWTTRPAPVAVASANKDRPEDR